MKSLLFVGTSPPPIGGVTVLSKQLYDGILQGKNRKFNILYFNSERKKSNTKNKISYFKNYLKKLTKSNAVTFQFSNIFSNKHFIMYFFARIFNKKIILRCFGGSAYKTYEKFSWIKKKFYKMTILKSDIMLFETKDNVIYFQNICKNYKNKILWFPNNKKIKSNVVKDKIANKFCFFGQVKSTKGVYDIYKASESLPSNINIDIYGPIGFDISKKELEELDSKYNAKYKGCIPPDKVIEKMKDYDVLLLPTYHEGEGYPGVIIEAYTLGMPVISTKWNSIKEIVDNNCGKLITPKNYVELHKAILQINNDKKKFIKLQEQAMIKAKIFEENKWNEYFIDICNEII